MVNAVVSEYVQLAHGDGGAESRNFIRSVFLCSLADDTDAQEDAALISHGDLALTADGFALDPPALPGVDIGKLAVCGTVNDLAVRGAVARWLTGAWFVPEGFPVETLRGFARSMAASAADAGALVVSGDTKILSSSDLRGPLVATTGVGVVRHASSIRALRPGDVLVVTDGVGEHAAALVVAREGLLLDNGLASDCRLLGDVAELAFSHGAHFMRDLTRGGLAAVLHEIADAGPFHVRVHNEAVPVRPGVLELTELVGLSPLHLACEGCAVVAIRQEHVDRLVARLREHPYARLAAVIGEVTTGPAAVELYDGGVGRALDSSAPTIPRLC